MKKVDILKAALEIARHACEKAWNKYNLDAGFYAMQHSEVEGRKCLIVSIIIADRAPHVSFQGFRERNQSERSVSSHPLRLLRKPPADKTDECKP